ncbi:hypothetical protein ACOMHN_027525 [Nucella lapillus]
MVTDPHNEKQADTATALNSFMTPRGSVWKGITFYSDRCSSPAGFDSLQHLLRTGISHRVPSNFAEWRHIKARAGRKRPVCACIPLDDSGLADQSGRGKRNEKKGQEGGKGVRSE